MPGYELVLQFRGRRVETEEEIVEIEDAVVELLSDGESWEGHEVGRDARNICLLTGDANATLARLIPFLERASLLEHVVAAARPLAGEAYTVLWPQDGRPAFHRA